MVSYAVYTACLDGTANPLDRSDTESFAVDWEALRNDWPIANTDWWDGGRYARGPLVNTEDRLRDGIKHEGMAVDHRNGHAYFDRADCRLMVTSKARSVEGWADWYLAFVEQKALDLRQWIVDRKKCILFSRPEAHAHVKNRTAVPQLRLPIRQCCWRAGRWKSLT